MDREPLAPVHAECVTRARREVTMKTDGTRQSILELAACFSTEAEEGADADEGEASPSYEWSSNPEENHCHSNTFWNLRRGERGTRMCGRQHRSLGNLERSSFWHGKKLRHNGSKQTTHRLWQAAAVELARTTNQTISLDTGFGWISRRESLLTQGLRSA